MRVLKRTRVIAGVVGGGLVCGGIASLIAVSSSVAAQPEPDPGDPRAQAFDGNAVTCAQAGLPGGIVVVDATITDNTYITITSVPEGITLTGTVVKGGPAYNVYPGDALDELHAPLVASGDPAEISHWFSCGIESTTAPPTTSAPPPTTSAPPTHAHHGDKGGKGGYYGHHGGKDTYGNGNGNGGEDELAWTGFPTGPAIGLGTALIMLGLLFIVPPRRMFLAFAHGRRRH